MARALAHLGRALVHPGRDSNPTRLPMQPRESPSDMESYPDMELHLQHDAVVLAAVVVLGCNCNPAAGFECNRNPNRGMGHSHNLKTGAAMI
eukprot:364035-Chlamydomonas_euryale.AAC.2